MQRSLAPELLDGPLPDPDVLRDNLRDLGRVNRWLGGAALSARAVDHLVPDPGPVELLDVGTGAGDIPLALLARAERGGRELRITGIDTRPEIVRVAVQRDPRLTADHRLTVRVADGRSLPYPDRSFDIVHASLLTHHLAPDEVVALLAEMRRVARVGIVVNDLLRSRLGWVGAWLLTRLATRNRYTRHDAPLSVRRAFTASELEALVAGAGLRIDGRWFGLARHRWALACRVDTTADDGERARRR